MNEYIKSGAYKWKITVPLDCELSKIECEGNACIENGPGKLVLTVADFQGSGRHALVTISNQKEIIIHTFPANVQRCYARISGDQLIVSNTIKPLMKENEKICLNGEVLLRQISNLFAPLDNLFKDFKLLDASSVFRVINREIVFQESAIKPIKSTADSVQDYIVRKYEHICQGGKPLAVLISAGYDSRLNLALCRYFSKKYGNEIILYHEYKDKKEHDIAKQIADVVKLPFVSISRDRFKNEPLDYVLSTEFIDFHGGIYRDTLARLYNYLDLIKLSNPDSVIIGLAGDPHKGKFYRDVHDIEKDTAKLLKFRMKDIKDDQEKEFMPYLSNKMMDERFTAIYERSSISNDPYFRTDFIFYHIQAAVQSTSRSPFLHLNFKIPFPLNDDLFFSQAFSLPMKQKIDAAISLNLMEKINPALNKIPYHSGNARSFRNYYLNLMVDGLNLFLPKGKDSSRRNEAINWKHHKVLGQLDGASSDITKKLESFIKGNLGRQQKNGRIKAECALRVYLFLRQIEKELKVEFIVDKI